MNVLALTPALYDTSPGQRFRIEQWARYLERDGFRFTFEPFENERLHSVLYQPGQYSRKASLMLAAYVRRLRMLTQVRRFDAVFISRETTLLGPAVIERLIRWLGAPMVFDFDDAIWVPYVSPANRYLSYLKCFGKTSTICRLSHTVMAGNEHLSEYARQYNEDVRLVPTTIDTEIYQVRDYTAPIGDRPVTIGWTGSYSTVQHLDTLRPVLQTLASRYSFRLKVIGTSDYSIDGVTTECREWNADTEVEDLSDIDIGIMPLPDDTWSRGKCGLKLLQYMAVGVPAIGSPVGVNGDIIRHEVDGFLPGSEAEWIDVLSRLIEQPQLRRDVGLRGRRRVEDHYSAKSWAPRVGEILQSAR